MYFLMALYLIFNTKFYMRWCRYCMVARLNIMNQQNQGEEQVVRVPMPKRHQNEMFAVVDKRLGGCRLNVQCADGRSRMARIPGSRKRGCSRIREGDLLIVKPWDVQDDKADVVYSYRPNQARFLSKKKKIPSIIDVF